MHSRLAETGDANLADDDHATLPANRPPTRATPDTRDIERSPHDRPYAPCTTLTSAHARGCKQMTPHSTIFNMDQTRHKAQPQTDDSPLTAFWNP